jgi:hypothetical protein
MCEFDSGRCRVNHYVSLILNQITAFGVNNQAGFLTAADSSLHVLHKEPEDTKGNSVKL